MPSPELRTSTVERAECEWQQQMERDPWMDRMTFGFAIAELFMTAWWNLEPKRFIKFWLKPPYKRLTVTAFGGRSRTNFDAFRSASHRSVRLKSEIGR